MLYSLYCPGPETFGSPLMFLLTYGKYTLNDLFLEVQYYKKSQN